MPMLNAIMQQRQRQQQHLQQNATALHCFAADTAAVMHDNKSEHEHVYRYLSRSLTLRTGGGRSSSSAWSRAMHGCRDGCAP